MRTPSASTSRSCGRSRARAVVLVGSRSDNTAAREALRAELDAFTRSGGRAACIGQNLLGVDTVLPENRAGAEALARALAALVTGGSPCWPGRARC